MSSDLDYYELCTLAEKEGLTILGAVTEVSLDSERIALSSWQQKGFAAEMNYMKRDASLLTDLSPG